MPYIDYVKRGFLSRSRRAAANSGELNYLFTVICNEYLENMGLNYQSINDCLGALEGAKLEFYRRIAAPYEDLKRKENGDVYSDETRLAYDTDRK